MDNLKVLRHARCYISAMSEGINPLTGEYAPPGDTISEERIQKCCAYITGIIDEFLENGGSFGKTAFSMNERQRMNVKISSEPIEISSLVKRINAAKPKNMTGITGLKIDNWLEKCGYITIEISKTKQLKDVTSKKKLVNSRSSELGITQVEKVNKTTGEVEQKLLYSENAQMFILSHINEIVGK